MKLTLYEDFKEWALKAGWFNPLSYKVGTTVYHEWLSPTGESLAVRVNEKGFIIPFSVNKVKE